MQGASSIPAHRAARRVGSEVIIVPGPIRKLSKACTWRTTVKMLLAVIASLLPSSFLFASSYYPARIDDAKATYLTKETFPVQGDGVADDSDGLQQAIDKVQDTTNQGIVFIPSGRYRLSK